MSVRPTSNVESDWVFPVYSPTPSQPVVQPEPNASEPELFFGGVESTQNDSASLPARPPQQIFQASPTQQPASPPTSQPQPRPVRIPRLPTTTVWRTSFARTDMAGAIDLVDRIVRNRVPEYLITANLNYLMLIDENPELLEVNQHCCCILADGNPIVWRSRLENSPLPGRVAGSDMIVELARLSAEKGYRIFFLGGAPGVADAAAEQLRQWFPQMQIAGTYAPPFRPLSSEEHDQMLHRIRQAKTDILLVAFGQPKGELFIYDNLQQLSVPVSIQLGASFDFLAGTAKRAPEVWQKFGCEWLYRAFSDPQRLLPRYGKNMLFLAGLVTFDIKQILESFWRKSVQPHVEKLLRRK